MIAMMSLSSWSEIESRSLPLSDIWYPLDSGWYSFSKETTKDDFPYPVLPIIDTWSPFSKCTVIFFSVSFNSGLYRIYRCFIVKPSYGISRAFSLYSAASMFICMLLELIFSSSSRPWKSIARSIVGITASNYVELSTKINTPSWRLTQLMTMTPLN